MSNKMRKNRQFEEFTEQEIIAPAQPAVEEEGQEDERMRYEDAEIDERILRAVGELGFDQMTPIQEQAITPPDRKSVV